MLSPFDMSAIERIESLKEDFSKKSGWEERYALLIEKGKKAPAMPEDKKTEANLVKGCQSQVWLSAELKDGHVFFMSDSDSALVKGLAAVLVEVYSGSTPEEIIELDAGFLRDYGFEEALTPSRANGLRAMIQDIRKIAQVYALL